MTETKPTVTHLRRPGAPEAICGYEGRAFLEWVRGTEAAMVSCDTCSELAKHETLGRATTDNMKPHFKRQLVDTLIAIEKDLEAGRLRPARARLQAVLTALARQG